MENNENNRQKRPKNRAVYSFRKNYPGSTGGSDYSIGESRKMQNRERRNKLVFAFVLLLVFCLSFVATSTAIKLSKRPVKKETEKDEVTVKAAATLGEMKALYFSSDIFSSEAELEKAIDKLKKEQADTAVIEFKTPDGDLCYESNLPAAKNAYATKNAYGFVREYVQQIKELNYRVIAKVTCFEDNKAATVISDAAITNEKLELFSDADTSRCWLNPYSQTAREYLIDILGEINGLDVDGFLLTQVTFPVSSNSDVAVYRDETAITDRNAVIKQFISQAIKTAGEKEVIIGVSFDAAFGSDLNGLGGNILDSEARYYAPDLRAASQVQDVLFDDTLFSGGSFAQFEFVKTYFDKLNEQQTENVFVPICDNAPYSLDALEDVNCRTYIID
ncbi:MAG: hypothetical protein E7515_05615 [Ruminococcaceae bacterium]|nr:hypothetical protein [Oscillospiraceae bacterium]